jgi:hypothetical protein
MPRVKPWSTAAAMRYLTPLTLAIVTLGLAACGEKDEPDLSASEATVPQADSGFDIIGTWKGTLRQKGLKPFRVTAVIRSLENDRRNAVSYTGIDCAGSWTFEGRYANSSVPDEITETYAFREVIDRGEGERCKGTGTVSLTPTQGGRLEYRFRGGGIESRGVLTRVD